MIARLAPLLCFCVLWMAPQLMSGQVKAPLALSGAEMQVALVVDVASGDTLYRFHESKRVTPASLTKLFTTVAAMDLLGVDYRFQTQCFLNKDKKQLVIQGGGDPSLGSSFFDSQRCDRFIGLIVEKLKTSGVDVLTGGIVIDLSFFGSVTTPSARLWEDMANYYGATPSSLTVGDNTFRLYLDSPAKVGELCTITHIEPAWGALPRSQVVASAGTADSAYIYGVAGCDNWYVSGSIPAGRKEFVVKGALPEPHRWFGQQLVAALNRAGFGVDGFLSCYNSVAVDGEPLVVFPSPPLNQLCRVVNKQSQNLYADHLFLTLGRTIGKPHWDGGAEVLKRYCRDSVGVETLSVYDGSGLSPFNNFSAADVVALLRHAAKRPFFDAFYGSLPISGVDGTIRNLWRDDFSKGRIHAKSGSMNGVLGYAGYIQAADNRLLAFCIVVNHHVEKNSTVRGAIEQWVRQFFVDL